MLTAPSHTRPQVGRGYVPQDIRKGEATREANKGARGKAKGGKVSRIQSVCEAQISVISFRIERKEARQKARRAKR